MKTAEDRYIVSRSEAARFLRITTRSLDRYIRAGKLSAARADNGQVFLGQKELATFKKGKPLELHAAEPFQHRKHEQEPSFYQKLYEQALPLIEEKEKKLEAAQYRIGQLESQLPNIASFTVKPLAQYDLRLADEAVAKLQQKMKREALNRKILAAILYIVLLLQPILWYLLRTPPSS